MKIPPQYLPVMPYLIVKDSKGFLQFAKDVFGATEQMIVPGENDQVMHGELRIHDAVIMFANATGNWSEKSAGMYMHVSDVDTVYDKALKNGATSLMPPQEKDYGYTAGFDDPFGNQWWIAQGE
jgi:PhnB protein